MVRRYKPTPDEVALIVMLLIARYERERGKTITRLRLSRDSLRRIAIRGVLRDSFLIRFSEALMEPYGWISVQVADEIVLLKISPTSQWTRLSSKRVRDVIDSLRAGDVAILKDAEAEVDEAFSSDGEPDDDE